MNTQDQKEDTTTFIYSLKQMFLLDVLAAGALLVMAGTGLNEKKIHMMLVVSLLFFAMLFLNVYLNRRADKAASLSQEDKVRRMTRARPFEKALLFLCGILMLALAAFAVVIDDLPMTVRLGMGAFGLITGIAAFKAGNRDVMPDGSLVTMTRGQSVLTPDSGVENNFDFMHEDRGFSPINNR